MLVRYLPQYKESIYELSLDKLELMYKLILKNLEHFSQISELEYFFS